MNDENKKICTGPNKEEEKGNLLNPPIREDLTYFDNHLIDDLGVLST